MSRGTASADLLNHPACAVQVRKREECVVVASLGICAGKQSSILKMEELAHLDSVAVPTLIGQPLCR